MAYLDIDFMQTAGVSARRSGVPTVPFQTLFSAIEQSVIKIAMSDPAASLLAENIWSRRFRLLFGTVRVNPLANPGLEALRRVVVSLLRGPESRALLEVDVAISLGMTQIQADTLRVRFAHLRPQRRSWLAR
jgi:hypothetical protein